MTELEQGGPSLGNLLGFGLVLREHRARLVLERRTLAVGVHLVDYEAIVSGIRFPLEGPVSAAGFRHRRCHVQRMTLEIERHALHAWLSARLGGRAAAGMRIESVVFEPAVRLRPGDAPEHALPWLLVTGRGRGGGVAWFGCALRLGSDGRCVTITPVRRWFIGRGQVDTAQLWRELARAIDPRRRGDAIEVGIDPALEAVRIPFVRAGWKLPGLEQLALTELSIDDRRARATWQAGAQPWRGASIDDDDDAVAAASDRVRAALARGERDVACAAIDALVEAASVLPAAQIAALRWGCEIAAGDRAKRRVFARARTRLQPTDLGARRELVAALAHPDDHEELVRHVRLWAQLAEGPIARSRCAIAIAGALAASGRHEAAREALPTTPGDPLADEIRTMWPRLLLDEPETALRAAHRTFGEAPPSRRTALWCDLAIDAADAGQLDAGWAALDAATPLGTDPRWTLAVLDLLARGPVDDARLAALAEHAARFEDRVLAEAIAGLRADVAATENAAPDDAASWLASIDDAFAQHDLATAIARVRGMLQALPMGPDAFAAMSTRGIDAALAHGNVEAAIELLDEALARAPDHAALAKARAEILAVAEDPRQRVRLLADIARRNAGAARIEALEERARILADVLGEPDAASVDLAAAFADAPDRLDIALRLADFHAARGRSSDMVELLARVFPRQRGAERRATLLRMAAAYRDDLGDLVHAEQALRHAVATTDDDDDDRETIADELAAILEQRGRWADLAHELAARVQPELAGERLATIDKAVVLTRLARLQRETLGDEAAAASAYEALDRAGMLPEEGLACLAHAWRRAGRHEDLVRLLDARAHALVNDPPRFAAARRRAAELLDGPLARPLDAVDRYLDAHVADPKGSTPRLRVLLVGVISVELAQSKILARIGSAPDAETAPLWSLLAAVLSHHPELATAAAAAYREALARDPTSADANEGLARLELRRGDIEAAWPHVCVAVRHEEIAPVARADLAAAAARSLMRAGNEGSARALLELVLESSPDHVAALLELARIHERNGDTTALVVVLEHLRTLPMSGAMRAEVLHRHALSLQASYRAEPRGTAAEVAIDDVLEALRADPTHPGARQLLLEIARLRGEWSLVVAALEAVLRTLGPGPARARVELEIAELTLTNGGDHDAATRRLEAAITEIDDDEIHARAVALAMRLRPLGVVAQRIAAVVESGARALGPDARARIDRLVARIRESSRDADVLDGDADEAAAACAELEQEASRAHGPTTAGWLQVAAVAWHRLGDGERAARAVLHALAEPHDERDAARLIADVALACGDETTLAIYEALQARPEGAIGPELCLQRASLARLLGRDAEALEDLGRLCTDGDAQIRRRALAELDQILAQIGSDEERIGVLRARFAELARPDQGRDDDGELADVAAELARLELALGDPARALATCRAGLRAGPLHRTLLRLQLELLEQHDLPDDLVHALERYAGVCASPRERSRHLVRAARIVLDRGAAETDTDLREAAAARASALLEAARAADDDDVPARALALPLAFAAGRGIEVDALGEWLLSRGRRDEPALVLAAISAARRTGSLELAVKIGQRDRTTILQTLLPALRQAATEIATTGPAERIDAVLAAASRLAGGPLALFDALRRWSADRPLQAGLALALSRMHEAHGDPKLARMLLALAAFLAPGGALEAWLVPVPTRDDEVLRDDDSGQLGGHSALRALLRASVAQRTDAWTNVVPSEAVMPADERRFREMFAHVGRFTGLARLLAGDDAQLVDRLDALATLASPEERPNAAVVRQGETFAKRAPAVPLATRLAALDEIAHWLSSRDHVARLRVELVRHWWLVATKKSHELRGALRTLAETVGTRNGDEIDAPQTLRSEEARWLLGALELYGSEQRRRS